MGESERVRVSERGEYSVNECKSRTDYGLFFITMGITTKLIKISTQLELSLLCNNSMARATPWSVLHLEMCDVAFTFTCTCT